MLAAANYGNSRLDVPVDSEAAGATSAESQAACAAAHNTHQFSEIARAAACCIAQAALADVSEHVVLWGVRLAVVAMS